MENSNRIVPPHLNAEVYRTDTTGTNTMFYLDCIRVHSDGKLLIGCSELTGRFWDGGVSVFESITEAQETYRKSKKSIYLTSGAADACFVRDSNKVLICEDNGTVSLWSHGNDVWNQWNQDLSVAEHDNAVMAVECLEPGKEYVTVGADGNVKVWDIDEMICIRNYNAAHSQAVYGVSVKPGSSTCFATGSLDNYITLWDDDVCKSVQDLITNDCGIRCLQWIDDHRIVFGDEAGVLSILDVRMPDTATKLMEFPAAVHRLTVNSDSKKIAVICDNKIVSVCDVNEESKCQITYHDRHLHSNYVRGAAWDATDSHCLHTVGWDGEIKTHHLQVNTTD